MASSGHLYGCGSSWEGFFQTTWTWLHLESQLNLSATRSRLTWSLLPLRGLCITCSSKMWPGDSFGSATGVTFHFGIQLTTASLESLTNIHCCCWQSQILRSWVRTRSSLRLDCQGTALAMARLWHQQAAMLALREGFLTLLWSPF